jgi:4-cresol dehydrogenase (hydroxylating)
MSIPPGVPAARFTQVLRQWRDVVGADWVFTSETDLDTYRDSYWPLYGEKSERVASAVVAPDSVEQVCEVMRIANAASVPIYPISTGKNLTYGGSAPAYSGSVILDLKRLNRILEVSERNAFALVEPGVSYFDLYRHIRKRGLKLWIDCPDPDWGSLIGNSLDYGAGYTNAPYRDHFEAHCGMEVVLAEASCCAPGWARCRIPRRGSSSATAWARCGG